MKNFNLLYWFHGHKCPMSTIGYKAGLLAKKLLKLRRSDYKYAVAKVFFKSCAIDGIQVGFPATFGNNNLIVMEAGEKKFIFENKKSELKLEVVFSNELIQMIDNHINLRKKAELDRSFKRYERKAYYDLYNFVLKTKPENLFIAMLIK